MVNIAVIGCGHWGPNHIRNFNSLPEANVVAAVDLDAARLDRVSQMFPGMRLEKDHNAVLRDPEVNAVVIVTPTATHHKLVREALLAGKHVLCEKPLCETASQAREIADLARTRKLVLMVGHVFLFNSGLMKIKDIIDSGDSGKLQYLSAVRTNLGPIRNDVNAAYDLATHDISIFNWFLNAEPEVVSATGGAFLQPGVEDVVFVTLRYPGDVIANIQASWLSPKKIRQISVVGTRNMVTWDDLELTTPVAIFDKGANRVPDANSYGEFLRISMWEGDVRLPKINLQEPLKAQDSYFLSAVQRNDFNGRSDGKFSAGVVRALEAVSESIRMNGAPVRISQGGGR